MNKHEQRLIDHIKGIKRDYGSKRERRKTSKFKITLDELRHLLSRGKCDICESLDPGTKNGWHIDHDHTTGKVRGLLCHRCNCFRLPAVENSEFLVRILDYLKDPPGA